MTSRIELGWLVRTTSVLGVLVCSTLSTVASAQKGGDSGCIDGAPSPMSVGEDCGPPPPPPPPEGAASEPRRG